MGTSAESEKTAVKPYGSFKALLNVLEKMEGAIPPRLDRSYLGGSEGAKTQLLATMRFFMWIDGSGTVLPALIELVNAGIKDRPRLIRQVLELHYADSNKLTPINGTQRQLEESFLPLTGDTARKAVTFYLHAAKYAQLPISKNFKIPHGQGAARSSRPASARRKAPTPPPNTRQNPDQEIPPPPSVDPKQRYLSMLLDRAAKDDTLDPDLLNRIEKLLGYEEQQKTNDSK